MNTIHDTTKTLFFAFGDCPNTLWFGCVPMFRDLPPTILKGVGLYDAVESGLPPEMHVQGMTNYDRKLRRDRTYAEWVRNFQLREAAAKGAVFMEAELANLDEGMAFLKCAVEKIAARFEKLITSGDYQCDGLKHSLKARESGKNWFRLRSSWWTGSSPNPAITALACWNDVEQCLRDRVAAVSVDEERTKVVCDMFSAAVSAAHTANGHGVTQEPIYIPYTLMRAAKHAQDQALLWSLLVSGSFRLSAIVLGNPCLSPETIGRL